MVIIGIDPGKATGGIAILGVDDGIWVSPMPGMIELADWLERYPGAHVFLEKAQSFPKQGIASAFNYGDHFGQIQGIVIAFGMPYTLVPPARWSKVMLQGTKLKDSPKARNIEAARRLFPNVKLVAEDCRRPHSGMVDALLIAEYGRRSLGVVF